MKRCWIVLPILLAVAFRVAGDASAQESALSPPDAATETQESPQDATDINPSEDQDNSSLEFDFGRPEGFIREMADDKSAGRDKGPRPRYVQADNVIISWSANKDVAWGYSKTTGRWTRQDIKPPWNGPVVGDHVGVIAAGTSIFAYSGQTGRWDVLELPKDSKPEWFVDDDLVLANVGDKVYTFAASSGEWTSPEANAESRYGRLPTHSEASAVPSRYHRSPTYSESKTTVSPDSAIRMFRLQHVESAEMQGVLKQIMPSVAVTLAPNSNAILANARVEQIETLDALISLLDQPPSAARLGSQREADTGAQAPQTFHVFRLRNVEPAEIQELLKQLIPSIRVSVTPDSGDLLVAAPKDAVSAIKSLLERLDQATSTGLDASSGKLHQAYQALEHEAAEMVSSIRRAGPTSDVSESQKRRLAQIVEEAFAARQRLQQAEVAEMTEKLDRVKQQIAERERHKQQIIDRRVEELLAPAPQWDPPAN